MTSRVATKAPFSLDDDAAEQFYESSDTSYITSKLAESAPMDAPREVEQFEVEETSVTRSFVSRAYEYADISRYTTLFDVTSTDVKGRILRACLPYRGLLEPPRAPPERDASVRRPLADGAAMEDDDEAMNGDGPSHAAESSETSAPATFVESQQPFNGDPDLYGPLWIPVTLILCLAMGSNVYAFVRAVVARKDVFHGSRLSTMDFTNLVAAASCIWGFLICATTGVVLGKRYVQDSEEGKLSYVLCVYGYSTAPLIPAVLLSAILGQSASWILMLMGTCLSTVTVVTNLWPKTDFIPPALRGVAGDYLPPRDTVNDTAGSGAATHGPGSSAGSGERTPLWWLRIGVFSAHILGGLLLKLRFF